MRTMRTKNNNGVSLVELMISMAIITIIGGILAYFLLIGGSAWHTGDAEIQANQEARRGMMSMIKELRHVQAITIRNMAGNLYVDNAAYDNISFVIIYDVDGDGDTINAAGSLEWSPSISYFVNNNQLIRQMNNANTVLANNVIGLQFVKTDDILEVTLQTRKTSIEQRQIQATLTSRLKMRN